MANQLGTIMAGAELATGPVPGNVGDVTAVTGTGPIVVTSGTGPIPNVTITPATSIAAGSMSAADKAEFDKMSVLIYSTTLAGVSTFSLPTAWTAEQYYKITVDFCGGISASTPANGLLTWQANADTGTNYQHLMNVNNSIISAQSSLLGTLAFAVLGEYNVSNASNFSAQISFFPLATGFARLGFSFVNSQWAGINILGSEKSESDFLWSNTATALTNFILAWTAGALFTGTVKVYGTPA